MLNERIEAFRDCSQVSVELQVSPAYTMGNTYWLIEIKILKKKEEDKKESKSSSVWHSTLLNVASVRDWTVVHLVKLSCYHAQKLFKDPGSSPHSPSAASPLHEQ